MNPRKLTDRVRVINADLVAGYGGQRRRDWKNPDVSALVPALLEPLNSTENTDARQATDTTWRLVCNSVDVDGHPIVLNQASRVRWEHAPRDLEVVGDVPPLSRNGVVDHYEVNVQLAGDVDTPS